MSDKKIYQSKKAQNTWIGVATLLVLLVTGHLLKFSIELVEIGVKGILGLFGVSVLAQGVQDTFKKEK